MEKNQKNHFKFFKFWFLGLGANPVSFRSRKMRHILRLKTVAQNPSLINILQWKDETCYIRQSYFLHNIYVIYVQIFFLFLEGPLDTYTQRPGKRRLGMHFYCQVHFSLILPLQFSRTRYKKHNSKKAQTVCFNNNNFIS